MTERNTEHNPSRQDNSSSSDLQSLFSRAFHCHQRGEFSEAEQLYLKVREILPANVNLLSNLGILYRDMGKGEQALACMEQARDLAPDNLQVWLNLGAVQEDRGRSDEAAAIYRRALALEPDNPQALNNLGKSLYQLGRAAEAREVLDRAVALAPNYPLALNNLGVVLNVLGQHRQAISCFERSLAVAPDDSRALYNLAGVYNTIKEFAKAIEYFAKTVRVDPDHSPARHMLAALTGRAPDYAPARYVMETFDRYAGHFDEHLTAKLHYTVPRDLRAFLVEKIGCSAVWQSVLDLGCGTGLAGQSFRDLAQRLVGVDLSGRMLDRAREKGIYDQLVQDDLIGFLNRSSEKFDLFLAADVFIYVGRLAALFRAVRKRAATAAHLLFSIERTADDRDLVLRKSGRYAHGQTYIERVARQAGFALLARRSQKIRKEQDRWIDGDLFILRVS